MMKKKTVLLLCLIFAVSMLVTSCGNNGGNSLNGNKTKSIFDTASEAYDEISAAYVIVDGYGSAVYNAWMSGIYDDDEMDIEFLADETGIPESELRDAFNSLYGDYSESTVFYLYRTNDDYSMFNLCVELVTEAYLLNGKSEEAKSHLEKAKSIMRNMSENYSDYEHYTNLKGFFTKTNAFFDYCESPDGSFEQCKTTINEYRNEIRDFKNDLDYIFEE